MSSPSSRQIDREAADWAARLDRGALTSDESSAFEVWLVSDQRRRGAFMRMRAIALHSERASALGPDFDPENYSEPEIHPDTDAVTGITPYRPTRRRSLWAGAAVAACIAGIVGVGQLRSGQEFETKLGEVRVVSLADGSVLTLNTDSRVAVRFTEDRRSIALLEGEALFDVAKDASRPFVVDAGDTAVRAVGTSFTVRRIEGAAVEVLVREGVVEVTKPEASKPVRLVANTRAVAPSAGPTIATTIPPEVVTRELAWREGRVAFEGATLAEAARTFSRYSEIHIVLGPGVADEQITGLFAANDPVTFAVAAAATLDLETEIGQGEVRISR